MVPGGIDGRFPKPATLTSALSAEMLALPPYIIEPTRICV
jgi:hypothetical protein